MIVVVMGMSKSGTTPISKTLHHSRIDMSPKRTGPYSKTKYEDPKAINILKKMVGTKILQSLYIPKKIIFNKKIEKYIIDYINSKSGDWGFKQPWLTLCYDIWKKYLPTHIAIGVKRNRKGLLNHYAVKEKKQNRVFNYAGKILDVQNYYNNKMEGYGIPIISFEDFLKRGPVVLEKIIGRRLKDVRDGKKHV